MIPYEELDRALARWKARSAGIPTGQVEPTRDAADDGAETVVSDLPPTDAYGSVPQGGVAGLPPPPEHTGEIDLESDGVVETYDDEDRR